MHKKISLFSLVLLVVAAIDSIRNMAASALFGSYLIFFFILSAIVFLIPTSLVAAELSAIFPEKGGVYHWVRAAWGEKWAMVAIWTQWMNTIVWFPTIVSFIAGTAAYLINPELAQNKVYMVCCIQVVFWTITWINTRGIHTSAKLNSMCGLVGMVLPMLFLITMGLIWALSGKPLQIQINADTLIPSLSHSTQWIALIAIMASFLGIELSGVHVNDIRDPQRNFPKALLISATFLLLSMTLGSLAIAFVVPAKDINLVAGVMQVFTASLNEFGLPQLIPVITVLIVIGSIGQMTNWLIAPARGLLHAAEFGYLPSFFTRKNKHHAPAHILVMQGVLVTIFCTLLLLVPSVNGFYWFLTALSTEQYMIMYLLMFFSALRLHYKYVDRPAVFKIPGRHVGMWITCLLGFFGCASTIIVSYYPPDNINIGSPMRYVLMIATANLITLAPLLLFFLYKAKKTARTS
jgi:glutamate:GABA antiporter